MSNVYDYGDPAQTQFEGINYSVERVE